MRWDEVTAICIVMSLVGGMGVWALKAAISGQLADFMDRLENKFVTHDQLKVVETRVDGLEARTHFRQTSTGN